MHLDLDQAIALTRLTAPPLDVERKTPRLISTRLGLRQSRKPIPDRGERARIGRRIRAWRPPNRALVNVDHLIKIFKAFDRLAGRRGFPRAIEPHRRRFVERLDRQR